MVSVLAALVVAALAAYPLLAPPGGLVVTGAEVVPAAPPDGACDVTVDVVGTVHTNGRRGAVEYRWLRGDGEATAPVTQVVDAGVRTVRVHLRWTVTGRGTYPAGATLDILRPLPVQATGGFVYTCP